MKPVLLCGLWLAATAAFAQPPEGPPPGGEHRGPPAEALAACKTAKAGDACSVTHGSRTVQGTCAAPEGRALACRPKDMPPPPDGGASGPRGK
ncbi:hypothetical protein [Roseateles sp. BYS96W]|uniref:DUF2282 domain-containing protein n=1 Tax=Pelomonas nitida TaxID=3299027 RepID=A0ABW7GA05_9BURK